MNKNKDYIKISKKQYDKLIANQLELMSLLETGVMKWNNYENSRINYRKKLYKYFNIHWKKYYK